MEKTEDIKFLQVEKIIIEEGEGDHPFVVRVYFTNGTIWTCRFEELYYIMRDLGRSEEGKYRIKEEGAIKEFPSGKFLLGRNLFLMAWIHPIYEWYLKKYGFNPPEEHIKRGEDERRKEQEKGRCIDD